MNVGHPNRTQNKNKVPVGAPDTIRIDSINNFKIGELPVVRIFNTYTNRHVSILKPEHAMSPYLIKCVTSYIGIEVQ